MNGGFKPGDVVRLKSGGPKMTMSAFEEIPDSKGMATYVRCVWFKGSDKASDLFRPETIELSKED
ncbi:YodC family protein [Undibacterium sp.]|uniref:YodC family protein n=1 Tax=Undibacterium sp. TaxID=1914977 RepID=UPI0035209EB9